MKYRASKLQLKPVSKSEEKQFLNENHYQGYCVSFDCFGLYNDNELIELMSFRRPRYNKKYDWELLRLATKKDCQVHGGASRLLKAFQEKHPLDSIISYCNRDKFDGGVYRALGFKSIGISKGYHYEKDGKTYHRSNFQKWRCLELWPQYIGQKITEAQIMLEQGYTRVDDVIGQEAFVLNDHHLFYIYEIEIRGYHYIGQHRYLEGSNPLTDGYFGSGLIVRRLQDKYGNGKKTILVSNITDQDTANRYEKCAIRNSRICYGQVGLGGKNINIKEGGQGDYKPRHGWSHSEETKRKMSEAKKGKPTKGHPCSEITKQLIAKANKGKKRSEELRQRLSESHKGLPGHKQTDEAKRKIGEANKGRKLGPISEETRLKRKQSIKKSWEIRRQNGKDNSVIRSYKWFTNGTENIRALDCPEGFRPGRCTPAWNKGKRKATS